MVIDIKKGAGLQAILGGAMKVMVSKETLSMEKGNVLIKLASKMEQLGDMARKRNALLEKDDTYDKEADGALEFFRESIKSEDGL